MNTPTYTRDKAGLIVANIANLLAAVDDPAMLGGRLAAEVAHGGSEAGVTRRSLVPVIVGGDGHKRTAYYASDRWLLKARLESRGFAPIRLGLLRDVIGLRFARGCRRPRHTGGSAMSARKFKHFRDVMDERSDLNVYGLRSPGTDDTAHCALRRTLDFTKAHKFVGWLQGREVHSDAYSLREEFMRETKVYLYPGEVILGAFALRLNIDTSSLRAPNCRLHGVALTVTNPYQFNLLEQRHVHYSRARR